MNGRYMIDWIYIHSIGQRPTLEGVCLGVVESNDASTATVFPDAGLAKAPSVGRVRRCPGKPGGIFC